MESLKLLSVVISLMCLNAQAAERAAPPKKWDKAASGVFFPDAFKLLEGVRPNFLVNNEEKKEEKEEEKVVHGDFDRADIMKKIERSEEAIQEILSSEKSFAAGLSKINQPVDVVIMMGKTMFHSDPDYSGDDDFLKFSEDMLSAANALKVCCKKSDYEGAGSAFSRIKKSCTSCHEKFR